MGTCGNCRSGAAAWRGPEPLFEIRRSFRARWNRLGFSVSVDSGRWTLVVEDAETRNTLHTGLRAGARAAQVAAAEFGIFWVLGPECRMIPERLVQELHWQEVW